MSEMVPRNRVRAGDADRDLVLNVLQQAHAAGRLGVEELSERQDRALSIKFTDEIPPLVEDLPEGAHLLPAPGPAQFGVTPPVVPPWRPGVPVAGDTEQGTVTIMSGRRVDIQPGTVLWRNFAFWGGDDIYLAGAMGPGVVITLELNAIMGGHSVYVPPGVRIIDQSIAIMAGNDVHKGAQGDGSNGTLIIKGFLFWAGSDIKLEKQG